MAPIEQTIELFYSHLMSFQNSMVEMLTEFIFAKTLSFMFALWISLSLMELLAMTMLQISCSCWLNTSALPPACGCGAVL